MRFRRSDISIWLVSYKWHITEDNFFFCQKGSRMKNLLQYKLIQKGDFSFSLHHCADYGLTSYYPDWHNVFLSDLEKQSSHFREVLKDIIYVKYSVFSCWILIFQQMNVNCVRHLVSICSLYRISLYYIHLVHFKGCVFTRQ